MLPYESIEVVNGSTSLWVGTCPCRERDLQEAFEREYTRLAEAREKFDAKHQEQVVYRRKLIEIEVKQAQRTMEDLLERTSRQSATVEMDGEDVSESMVLFCDSCECPLKYEYVRLREGVQVWKVIPCECTKEPCKATGYADEQCWYKEDDVWKAGILYYWSNDYDDCKGGDGRSYPVGSSSQPMAVRW